MITNTEIPLRKDVPAAHRWDLSRLSKDEKSWESDLGTLEAMIDKIPMGLLIPPDAIARAHLFLASDEAAFITGQCLFVDGGMSVGI